MGSFLLGFAGLFLFGWSGTFRPQERRAPIFQGSVGTLVAWIVMLLGAYMVYRGWLRPFFAD